MQAPKIPDNIFWQASKQKNKFIKKKWSPKYLLELYPNSARISPDFSPNFYIGIFFFFFGGGGGHSAPSAPRPVRL